LGDKKETEKHFFEKTFLPDKIYVGAEGECTEYVETLNTQGGGAKIAPPPCVFSYLQIHLMRSVIGGQTYKPGQIA